MIKLSQILLSEQRFTSVKLRDGSIAHVGDLVTIDSLIEDHPYKKTSIIKSIDQWDGKGTIVYVEYPNGQTHEQTYHRFDMIKYEESIKESVSNKVSRILYHVTTKENAKNILKYNYFRPSLGMAGIMGLSCTTDHAYFWGSMEARFVLDAKKLSEDYELRAVNEHIPNLNESEIKVISDKAITNADRYIIRVEWK